MRSQRGIVSCELDDEMEDVDVLVRLWFQSRSCQILSWMMVLSSMLLKRMRLTRAMMVMVGQYQGE